MHATTRRPLPAFLLLFVAGLLGAGVAAAVSAPPADADNPDADVTRLTEMVVTGSNIPTAADATAVPVAVIGPADIKNTGLGSNVLEVLSKAIPTFGGRYDAANGNVARANQTLGGSQLALRNLQVLVLINGRRVETSGAQGLKGNDYVDVSQVPTAAIARVEVVTDGASAIYGSDAVGGVVNFILKSNYNGAELGGRYAAAKDYWERSAYLVAGAAKNGISLTVAGSLSKTSPLYEGDRPFSDRITGQTSILSGVVGTNVLNPALNSPSQTNPVGAKATATAISQLVANGTYQASTAAAISGGFNSSPFVSLMIGQEQKAVSMNGSADVFGKRLGIYADQLFASVRGFTQALPVQSAIPVPANAPYNPLTVAAAGVGFAYLPAPKQVVYNTWSSHSAVGLRGDLSDAWSYDLSYTYGDSRIREDERNVLYAPNLTAAVAGGYDANGNAVAGGAFSKVVTGYAAGSPTVLQPALDPFARNPDPASLAHVFGTGVLRSWTHLSVVDAKIVGTPFELPGGKIAFALGAQTRTEHVRADPDANSQTDGPAAQSWTGGAFFGTFDKSRKVDAFFGEVRVPVTGPGWSIRGLHALEVDLAARQERYSDVGKSRVPKIGMRWQPIDDQLTIRYSFSESFVAPTLFQKFSPLSRSLGVASVITNVFGLPGGQYQAIAVGNPDLQPTTELSHSVGVVISPRLVPGLTLSVDYLSAIQKNFPAGSGATSILASVEQLGPASPYASEVYFNAPPGQPGYLPITQPGQVTTFLKNNPAANMFVADLFVNQSGAKIQAVDVNLAYQLPTQAIGAIKVTSAATLYPTYDFKALPTQGYYQYVGYVTNGGAGFQGSLPKYRIYSVLEWRKSHWSGSIANTYIPALTDAGGGGITFATSTTLKPIPVDRYTAWDVHAGYTFGPAGRSIFRGAEIDIGVNNVFNRMPPLAPQAYGPVPGADTNTYSAVGRLLFVSSRISF